MSSSASQPDPSPGERITHALKTELTVIRGRAQLAQRNLREDIPLTTGQLDQLWRDLAVIDVAVSAMVTTIDAHGWSAASDQKLQRP